MPQSFDIFDTLLTRLVSPPEAAFELVAQKMRENGWDQTQAAGFAQVRREAEKRARRHRDSGEVTLTGIYAEVGFTLSLPAEKTDILLQWELDTERALLVPVPGGNEIVERARSKGGTVLYISDMYLPSAFLIEQLKRHAFWQDGDGLYVSCEYDASKGDGKLFQKVELDLGMPGNAFHHTGNHPHSDGAAARRRGWTARLCSQNNSNRYEELLEKNSGKTAGITACFAAASRLARLETGAGSEREEIIADVAAGVVAPALVSFLLWLLREAANEGIKRLYFLSRDGQILHQMAKRLAPKIGCTIELRYLYGSRQAWHTARARSMDDFFQEYVLESPDGLSLEMVFERLGLDPALLEDELTACGFSLSRLHESILPDNLFRIKKLFDQPLFRKLLRHKTDQNRARLLAYLRQEGWGNAGRAGLVDIGWTGKSLRSLYDVLKEAGLPRAQAFFFGLMKVRSGESGPRPRGFLFDEERKLGSMATKAELRYLPILVENFCAGDHGGLRGFVEQGDRIAPDLRSDENREVLDWGLPVIRKAVDSFCDHLLLPPNVLEHHFPLAPVASDLLRLFYESPSTGEARIWGTYPAETDPNAAFHHSWATPFLWSDVWHLFRRGHLPENSTTWRAARQKLTPAARLRAMGLILALRARAGAWRNILARETSQANPKPAEAAANLSLAADNVASQKS